MEIHAGTGGRLNSLRVAVGRTPCLRPTTPEARCGPSNGDSDQAHTVIGIGQLRSHTLTYLGRVRAGETLDIVRRGKRAARIVPAGDRRVVPIPARYATPHAEPAGGWVGLDELRTRAGQCLDRVAAGETINVVRAGRLLALIVPVADCGAPPPLTQGEIGLDEFRSRAGRYVDRVLAGETLRVIRRGQVVQILSPSADSPSTA